MPSSHCRGLAPELRLSPSSDISVTPARAMTIAKMSRTRMRSCRKSPARTTIASGVAQVTIEPMCALVRDVPRNWNGMERTCLLYTSDAADDLLCVDLGG